MNLKAFKENILPTKDKLYRFALSLLQDSKEAEDVVQEVLIKTWQDRKNWHRLNNLEAWCMKLTRNLSVDKLRSKHRRTTSLHIQHDRSDASQNPHRKAELNDSVQQIQQLMLALPEKQRTILQLRDVEGYSYQEISDTLELPLNQIRVNLHRARQQIRNQLIKKESYGL